MRVEVWEAAKGGSGEGGGLGGSERIAVVRVEAWEAERGSGEGGSLGGRDR